MTAQGEHSTEAPRAAIQRILVVRLGAMGDVIHALPAVGLLRSMFPTAEIGWVIEERWAELLLSRPSAYRAGLGTTPRAEKPIADTVHIVNTLGWRTDLLSAETRKAALATGRELRRARYDVAIDFQGAWKSAALAILSGAPMRVGFREARERGASLFYNHAVVAEGTHIVQQNVSLLSALVHLQGDERAAVRGTILREPPPAPELPYDEGQEIWANEELVRRGLLHQDFAIFNPGAGWGAKCWPAERYAQVARELATLGVHSLINCGPREDELAQAVEAGSAGAAQILRCSVGELTALMRRARLFIGGDTGPLHLAAALRVPVVGIYGPTDPARNGPYATEAEVLRSPESVTNHSRRAQTEVAMFTISAADVSTAARVLLERTSSSHALRQAVRGGARIG